MNEWVWRRMLSVKLREWGELNNYPKLKRLARELGISDSVWGRIIRGSSITKDTAVYARLFQRTKLPEADPRKLPPHNHTTPNGNVVVERAWTEEQWEKWLSEEGTHMAGRQKHPWAIALADAIKASAERRKHKPGVFRERLDIPPLEWGYILRAEHIVGEVEYYAKIFHYLVIAEADPRRIPPRRNGEVRAWTDTQWLDWIAQQSESPKQSVSAITPSGPESLEQEAVISSLLDDSVSSEGEEHADEETRVSQPETSLPPDPPWIEPLPTIETEEEPEVTQPPQEEEVTQELPSEEGQPLQQPETPLQQEMSVGSLVGTLIDAGIAMLSKQLTVPIVQAVSEEIARHNTEERSTITATLTRMEEALQSSSSAQGSSLEDLANVMLKKLEATDGSDSVGGRGLRRLSFVLNKQLGELSVKRLAELLTQQLQKYLQGSSKERDDLVREFGQELAALDSILHILVANPDIRERNIRMKREAGL